MGTVKILVKSIELKNELLEASKYIHDLRNIDTDIPGVNLIAHLYLNPDLIEIDPTIDTVVGE